MSENPANMTEDQPSSGNAPSAEEFKDRVDQIGEQSNLGVGGQEPDPATAEQPPSDVEAGDAKRTQT
jgi:hypothetical protein